MFSSKEHTLSPLPLIQFRSQNCAQLLAKCQKVLFGAAINIHGLPAKVKIGLEEDIEHWHILIIGMENMQVEIDIQFVWLNGDSALGRWGSRITDAGLLRISHAKCFSNLTSISLWGVTAITDEGVVQLVSTV